LKFDEEPDYDYIKAQLMTSLKNYLTATKTTPHSIDRYIIKLREIENNGNYLNPDHLKFDWNYNMAMQANYSYS